MSSPMKCPNPSCPFLFDPSQVPPGAVLACPRCGMQFTLPPPPAYAPPQPANPYPQGYGQPAPPPASNLQFGEDESSTEESNEERPRRDKSRRDKTRAANPRSRKRPAAGEPAANGQDEEREALADKKGPWKVIILAVVGTILICGILGSIVFFRGKFKQSRPDQGKELKYDNFQIEYKFPDSLSGWERDDSVRNSIEANILGYRKGSGADTLGWAAIGARKTESLPGPAEIERQMVDILRKGFQEIPEKLTVNDDKMLGLPASRFIFRGVNSDNITCAGEIFAVAARGSLYYVCTWGTDNSANDLAGEFAAIRGGLRFITGGASREARPLAKDIRAPRGEAYKLFVVTDYENRWYHDRNRPATLRDPKGALWLEGWENLGRRVANTTPPAELIVAVLDGGADASAIAQEHIIQQLTDGQTKPEIEPITGEPTGDPALVTESPKSEVTRFRMRIKGADASFSKLVVYSTLESEGKLVVAYATCSIKNLNAWEQRLMLMVGSLRKP